jgi:flagellar M-ring protein FliF
MGFDAKRGDQVSVVSMAFSGAEADQKETVWWRAAWFWELVRLVAPYVVALVLGLLAFMAIRRLAAPTVVDPVAEPGLAAEGDGAEPASAEATSEAGEEGAAAGEPAAEPGPSGELKPDVVRLTNTYEADAAVARELVKQDPRRAAQVIKEWLGNEK